MTRIESQSEDEGSKNRQETPLKQTREARVYAQKKTIESNKIDSQSENVGLKNRQETPPK